MKCVKRCVAAPRLLPSSFVLLDIAPDADWLMLTSRDELIIRVDVP